jgi:hypothetical protein
MIDLRYVVGRRQPLVNRIDTVAGFVHLLVLRRHKPPVDRNKLEIKK